MIKAVLLDLDNTLVDYMKIKRICSYAAADAMEKAGLKVANIRDQVYNMYLENLESSTIFGEFIRKFEGRMDFKVLVSGVHAYRMCKYTNMKPYPGVIETLKALKKRGFKIGIVTDTYVFKAYERLFLIGALDYIDDVVSSKKMGTKKPDKAPFLRAAKWLKVKPSEILFVGDWPEKDLLGAKRSGMKTCFARYGCDHDCMNTRFADFTIDKFEDLLKVQILAAK